MEASTSCWRSRVSSLSSRSLSTAPFSAYHNHDSSWRRKCQRAPAAVWAAPIRIRVLSLAVAAERSGAGARPTPDSRVSSPSAGRIVLGRRLYGRSVLGWQRGRPDVRRHGRRPVRWRSVVGAERDAGARPGPGAGRSRGSGGCRSGGSCGDHAGVGGVEPRRGVAVAARCDGGRLGCRRGGRARSDRRGSVRGRLRLETSTPWPERPAPPAPFRRRASRGSGGVGRPVSIRARDSGRWWPWRWPRRGGSATGRSGRWRGRRRARRRPSRFRVLCYFAQTNCRSQCTVRCVQWGRGQAWHASGVEGHTRRGGDIGPLA